MCFVSLCLLFFFQGEDFTKWKQDDDGYTYHLISAITEWIMATTTIFFLLLFTYEFRKIIFVEPGVEEKDDGRVIFFPTSNPY